ncbi:UDP-N-acetylglucosamine 2-epimerase, partial [Staphylococcus epidermidis]|uniref:UDP-N-acetylglucosamine 2-epimerase n=1 Tax=Staphylococcus epidermidis TaxID=1282 RepID=UPI0037DA4029
MIKKVVTIFPTTPQPIKIPPFIKTLHKHSHLQPLLLLTPQHTHILHSLFNTFNITPHYHFNIIKTNQTLSQLTSEPIKNLQHIIQNQLPHILLLHAHTLTTFSGPLPPFY